MEGFRPYFLHVQDFDEFVGFRNLIWNEQHCIPSTAYVRAAIEFSDCLTTMTTCSSRDSSRLATLVLSVSNGQANISSFESEFTDLRIPLTDFRHAIVCRSF